MRLLGVDIGTTRCKVALFDGRGSLLRSAAMSTPTERTLDGYIHHEPEWLWRTATTLIGRVSNGSPVDAVGVASMAEAGLLVDGATGAPCTPVIAWYDTRAQQYAELLGERDDALALFRRSGLHPSFKYGLPKILWMRQRDPAVTEGTVWLSVADFIVHRLTGSMATDPTLAARTYAYDIVAGRWDRSWIESLALDPNLFPKVLPSGDPAGTVSARAAEETALPAGTPVAVAGHDHICTLLAAGVLEPGPVLDSIGTAESMIGVLDGTEIGERELKSGLAVVPHVLPGRLCWLGGLSAAGGSIEWLRAQLGAEPLSYDEVQGLAEAAGQDPTGILYYPYLHGSGAPLPDRHVRAAFIGIDGSHGRADLIKAVLEGTGYEAESIRRAGEALSGVPIEEIIAVGGGTQNRAWISVKAAISGRRHVVPHLPFATALGAALAAGLGSGIIGQDGVLDIAEEARTGGDVVTPDPDRHGQYRRLYETAYLQFQGPLREQRRPFERAEPEGRHSDLLLPVTHG